MDVEVCMRGWDWGWGWEGDWDWVFVEVELEVGNEGVVPDDPNEVEGCTEDEDK